MPSSIRPLNEEVDATGRYRVLWGNFADLAQALRKSRRYLDDTLNWSPEDSPYPVLEMAREGRLKFLGADADADAAPSSPATRR